MIVPFICLIIRMSRRRSGSRFKQLSFAPRVHLWAPSRCHSYRSGCKDQGSSATKLAQAATWIVAVPKTSERHCTLRMPTLPLCRQTDSQVTKVHCHSPGLKPTIVSLDDSKIPTEVCVSESTRRPRRRIQERQCLYLEFTGYQP